VGGQVGALGGGLEPGDRRDAPAKQLPELLLRLATVVTDVAEGLGVLALCFADPFPEGGPLTSHHAPSMPPGRVPS
jgi:hypothetical protein